MVFRFRFCLSLRSLSRIASDYSSDSVVCLGILRPLRSLREIKIMAFCFHGVRKERRVLSPFVFHACAGRGASSLFAYAATRRVSNVRVCGWCVWRKKQT